MISLCLFLIEVHHDPVADRVGLAGQYKAPLQFAVLQAVGDVHVHLALHQHTHQGLRPGVTHQHPAAISQLGRRGLYDFQLEGEELQRVRLALLWVLNLSDGSWSLEDIARRAEVPLESVETAAEALLGAGILESA